MKVLALCSYPIQAAATRYRLDQFVGPLAEREIELNICPFLDSKLFELMYRRRAWLPITAGFARASLHRLKDILESARADVVLIQRESMIFGPPITEWLVARLYKRPMILDLDDATYVPYSSPTYGGLGRALKWVGKTDTLIHWSRLVTCGNRAIAQYASSRGAKTLVIPTVVDTEVFHPIERDHRTPVLGWIGTHSTFPFLESIFPVLQQLAKKHEYRLKIVGAGRDEITLAGVDIENLKWELEREVKDFQSLDIGLYPIDAQKYSREWAAGKSGFKAIQYMAVGIPYVATPIGAAAEIGEEGTTHFCANSHKEWLDALASLLSDGGKRRQMGLAGRQHVTKHYGLKAQAEALAQALHEVVAQQVSEGS